MQPSRPDQFGSFAPGRFDRAVLALTNRLPVNWLGLRLAILLRRLVTTRLERPAGALDVNRWGLRLRLHPCDNGCEKNLLFTPQMYEPAELSRLAGEIEIARRERRPFVFVDVGANVGLFSLFVAAHAGANARILAVEPEPGNMARLRRNLEFNPGLPITPIPVALSDEAGHVSIVPDDRDRGGARLGTPGHPAATQVPATTLSELLTREGVAAVDALKIDVEGSEDRVLVPFFQRADRALWPRMIVIEDSHKEWRVDLFAILAANGYATVERSKQNVVLRRSP